MLYHFHSLLPGNFVVCSMLVDVRDGGDVTIVSNLASVPKKKMMNVRENYEIFLIVYYPNNTISYLVTIQHALPQLLQECLQKFLTNPVVTFTQLEIGESEKSITHESSSDSPLQFNALQVIPWKYFAFGIQSSGNPSSQVSGFAGPYQS